MGELEAEFAELYNRYRRFVASYCARRLSPDRVDDAVSEVFLIAWRRFDDLPQGDAALRWLYGTAYKVIGRQWRTTTRRKRLVDRLGSVGVDLVPIPEEVVVVSEESRRVRSALSRLSALDREVLLLAAWEELKYHEIAEVLDINVDAVRQRFHKAKGRLTHEYNRSGVRSMTAPAVEEGGVL